MPEKKLSLQERIARVRKRREEAIKQEKKVEDEKPTVPSGEKINVIKKLNAELTVMIRKEEVLYKEAMKDYDKVAFTKKKKDAKGKEKEIEVTFGELWEETRIVGFQGEAGKILTKEYPKLMGVVKTRESKNKEINDYMLEQFGFDQTQMTIGNYIILTEAMIESALENK